MPIFDTLFAVIDRLRRRDPKNAKTFDQLARTTGTDAALRDFSQRLLEATTEKSILDETVRATKNLLQADYTDLFLFDATDRVLHLRAGLGWEAGIVGVVTLKPSAESLAGYAFLQKESVQAKDLSRERRFSIPAFFAAHGVRAGAAVPLGVRDQPVGVLAAYYKAPHRPSDEERRILQSIAQQTALALEKVRLQAELQTNLRRLQETQAQLIQSDKLKTLLSDMAHDLTTPLTSILLSAQILKQHNALPDTVRRRIEAVEQECTRASRIIKNLRAFARQQIPERRRVDLIEVIRTALALQAPEFDANQIRVVTDLATTLPAIWADSTQLEQVFVNLFANATQAMKATHKPRTLTVRAFLEGSEVCVEVDDAGERTGSGLSLSIGNVEANGGRMSVENLTGSGARVTIRLPIPGGAEPVESPSREVATTASRPARILVVDDEEQLREVLTEDLSALGNQVESAASGREAILSLEGQAYDLVVLDLRMPDIDGREVWRWIQSRNPTLAPRVVFMTGDILGAETLLRETGRPVLTKPLAMERVHRVVSEVLSVAPSSAS